MFNTPNYIEVYDNALTSYECREIIKYIESQELYKGRSGDGSKVMPSVKDDWETSGDLRKNTFVDESLRKALYLNVKKYTKKYPSVDNLLTFWGIENLYNLQKYNPGQGYHKIHCEQDSPDRSLRILTWMFYLNTVKSGGGTYFGQYNKTLNAKEGRLVIWPAYWTHPHRGIVSHKETKYIATGWFRFFVDDGGDRVHQRTHE